MTTPSGASHQIVTGGCACGAVRYEGGPVKFAFTCACRACQRLTGTAHAVLAGVPRDSFTVTGQPGCYARPGDSGEPVEQFFCRDCGSPLFGKPDTVPRLAMIFAGSLDDPGLLAPKRVMYRAAAPAWDLLPDDPED